MNRFLYIVCSLFLLGCAKEEAVPVNVDFSVDVFNNDFSIPVQLVIFNNTEGAETYEWTFEGGVPATSTNRSPGIIVYNQPGSYNITLTASNEDGSEDTETFPLVIDPEVIIDFDVINEIDTFSPAVFEIVNTTAGATDYKWSFEGGIPSESTAENPGKISFIEPGEHTISLEVTNGRETYDLQKVINVDPYLVADFNYEVAFIDDDLQTPVSVTIENNSISAINYKWTFSGATPSISTEKNPQVIFTEVGTQTLTLEATNGKETKTKTLTIDIASDTNLRIIDEVILGINTAHNSDVIGAFYSLEERKVFTEEEITEENTANIDVVFFGLNSTFNRNRFVSPNDLGGTTFDGLTNATSTLFVNSQELCVCPSIMTVTQFDGMVRDNLLNALSVEETVGGSQDFDTTTVPRIVLFETEEGKKGAIKIIEFVEDGDNSFIRASMKYQKLAR